MGVESESEEKIWKKSKGKKLAMSSNFKIQKKSIFFEFSNRVFSMPKICFRIFCFVSILQRWKSEKNYTYQISNPSGSTMRENVTESFRVGFGNVVWLRSKIFFFKLIVFCTFFIEQVIFHRSETPFSLNQSYKIEKSKNLIFCGEFRGFDFFFGQVCHYFICKDLKK